MDLEKRLAAEHSRALSLAIVKYIGSDKNRFKELMTLFLKGDYRLTQRAAWPLSYACIEQPQLVKLYFSKLIGKLNDLGNHPAVKRNILRIFQEINIPEKYQGSLIDACFKIIADPAEPIAPVAFAISTASKLCKPFPELSSELKLFLNQRATYPQSPAIGVRIKRALKELATPS